MEAIRTISKITTLLSEGSSGPLVLEAQRELLAAGFNPGPLDGVFGPSTKTAVMNYQRRYGLAVDGIIGPQTWDALKSDGYVPAGAGTSGGVAQMLSIAASYVGYREGANNANMFSTYFGRPAEPWCADFVSYCATRAGLSMNTASAQEVQNIITRRGYWKGLANPQPGDAVTFNWAGNRSGWADHVGLVEQAFSSAGVLYIQTIEGNSSDQVARRQYRADASVIKGYGVIT